MGLAEPISDPHNCDHHSCSHAAVLWFEPCAGPDDGRRFYACDGHSGLFAQGVAMASAVAGKVV